MKKIFSDQVMSQNIGKVEVDISDNTDILLKSILHECKYFNQHKLMPESNDDYNTGFQDDLKMLKDDPETFKIFEELVLAAVKSDALSSRGFKMTSRKANNDHRVMTVESGKKGCSTLLSKFLQLALKLQDSDRTLQVSWVDFQGGLFCHNEGGSALISQGAVTTLTSSEVDDLLRDDAIDHSVLNSTMDKDAAMTKALPIQDGIGETISDFIDVATSEWNEYMNGEPYSVGYADFLAFCSVYNLPISEVNLQNVGGAGTIPEDSESHAVDISIIGEREMMIYSPPRGSKGKNMPRDALLGCDIVRMALCLMKGDNFATVKTLKSEIPLSEGDTPNWGVVKVDINRLYCFDGEAIEAELQKRHTLTLDKKNNHQPSAGGHSPSF